MSSVGLGHKTPKTSSPSATVKSPTGNVAGQASPTANTGTGLDTASPTLPEKGKAAIMPGQNNTQSGQNQTGQGANTQTSDANAQPSTFEKVKEAVTGQHPHANTGQAVDTPPSTMEKVKEAVTGHHPHSPAGQSPKAGVTPGQHPHAQSGQGHTQEAPQHPKMDKMKESLQVRPFNIVSRNVSSVLHCNNAVCLHRSLSYDEMGDEEEVGV